MTAQARLVTFLAMSAMNQRPDWVRELEADEAVFGAYQHRAAERELFAALCRTPRLNDAAADRADWLAAEQEVGREVEARGHWADERP
jgi:hypothetical protein